MKPLKAVFIRSGLFNLLIFIIISYNSVGQEWDVAYPVPNMGRQVVSTFDSCYLATGTNGFDDPGVTIKLNQEGEILWVSPYGGLSIEQTCDSGYIIAGMENLYDAFLRKFDKSGNLIWNQVYGGSDQDYFSAVIQSSDSCFVACGFSQSYGDSMIYIVKTDRSGNLLWRRNFSCIIRGQAEDLIEVGSNYYISGHSQDLSYNYNPFIIKLNAFGETIWKKDFQLGYTGLSIAMTKDSSLVMAGGNILSRFSLDGDSLWCGSFEPSFTLFSVDTASDNGFILSGGFDIIGPNGFQKVNTLVKTDSLGNITWLKCFPGGNNDFWGCFESVIATGDLGYVACGYSVYENSNKLLRVIKTDSSGSVLAQAEYPINNGMKHLFPNPTNGKVNVNLNNIKCIEVFNNSGTFIMSGNNENEIDLGMLPQGIYILRVIASDAIAIEKVIKH